MGMVTNFVGIQKDFTVPCGVRADVGVRVKRADGAPAAVGRATWRLGIWRDGAEAVATRFGELLPAPDGAGEGDLFWRFPVLEAGLWRYELTARGSDGEVSRVFYGVIGSAVASDIVADGEVVGVKGWRMLEVLLPEVAGGKVEAHWLSGDYVLALCEVARGEADRAGTEANRAKTEADRAKTEADRAAGVASGVQDALDGAVDEATQRAERAAGRAENAAVRAESAKDVVVSKFEETDAFIEAFWDRAHTVIVPNTKTGTWEIGGFNTGVKFCGENGKAPEINGVGEWLVYDWEKGWVNTGVMAKGQDGFSPNINSEGNWVWKDTHGEIHVGPSAYGRDGKDGSVVVRHLVGSFEDIPTEGETCNSDHIYYVPIASELTRREVSSFRAGDNTNVGNFRGEVIFAARRSASVVGAENTPAFGQEQTGRRLVRFGMLAGFSNGDEPSAEALYAHLYFRENGAWSYLGKSAEAVAQVSGVESFWEFEDLVLPIGAYDMRVVFSRYEERETAEQNKETVRVQVVDNPGDDSFCGENRWAAISSWVLESVYTKGYDVYHWVHKADGSEGWVPVNELYDLATAEVYGLMKYATDLPVQDGAPVGKNSSGQACVPRAEYSVAGSGRLSDGTALNDRNSGLVGMDSNGAFRTSKASHERHGSVKYSREDTLARCLCIGEVPDGTMVDNKDRGGTAGCTRAAHHTYGVVKTSFTYNANVWNYNNTTYMMPIGMRSDIDAAKVDDTDNWYTGANGHLAVKLADGGALRWHSTGQMMTDGAVYSTGGYLEVKTDDSFSQEGGKLVLMKASASLLGGVNIQESLESGSSVPTGTAVMDYLAENYYTKQDVIDGFSDKLKSYATQSWTRNNFVSKSSYTGWKDLTDKIITTNENRLEVAEKAIVANKTACVNSITGLADTVSSNKTACDNSVKALNEKIAALEDKTDGYLKMVGAFEGTVELWGGTAEEFAKVDITGKRMFMTLEN